MYLQDLSEGVKHGLVPLEKMGAIVKALASADQTGVPKKPSIATLAPAPAPGPGPRPPPRGRPGLP